MKTGLVVGFSMLWGWFCWSMGWSMLPVVVGAVLLGLWGNKLLGAMGIK